MHDLLIIGGGINGAAVAELAAENGWSVALLEKDDFGAGVTSRSTRLIHGGLRYLEHAQVGLVRESLREREALLQEFPWQVRPVPFLIPVYRRDSRAAWWIRAGLATYQLIGHSSRVPRHRALDAAGARRLEPGLESRGLRGGFQYYDCQAVYPERLALELALRASERGAEVRNHAPVTGFLVERGAVTGVRVEDGQEHRARLVINAAGPWADAVRRLLPAAPRRPLLRLVSGAHLVVAGFPGAPSHAIYHEASSDRRPFFILPWRGLWLIGTTETECGEDPHAAAPTQAEVEYLVRETNLLFPGAGLRAESVLYSYAGPRPLLHSTGNGAQALSRDHAIYDHEKQEGLGGLMTLVGGKLTTARAFAQQALAVAAAKLGRGRLIRRAPATPEADSLPPRLAEIYGGRAAEIVSLAARRPELDRPVCASSPTTAAEIVYAVEREKARTLGDLLLRRTGLAFGPCLGRDCALEAARAAGPSLGWDEAGIQAAVAQYEQELSRTLYRGAAA